MPEPMSGCWLWIAAVWKDGYGNFRREDGRCIGAHRMSWILYRGAFNEELRVLHHCDNPCCVNPDHLFLGTDGDNAADKAKKGRAARMLGAQNPSAKLTANQAAAIAADATKNACDLAAEYGVSSTTIEAIKKGEIWSHACAQVNPPSSRRPSMDGAKNPKAKITDEIASRIKADTRKTRFVAADFGVSKAIVTNIRSGKTWKHVGA